MEDNVERSIEENVGKQLLQELNEESEDEDANNIQAVDCVVMKPIADGDWKMEENWGSCTSH
jgi:hypothetical protein